MVSKLISMTRGVRPTMNVDQIGLQLWGMAVLVIGLSLAMRLNNQSTVLQTILLGALVFYLVGLVLFALGVKHVARTHFRPKKPASAPTCAMLARPSFHCGITSTARPVPVLERASIAGHHSGSTMVKPGPGESSA